MEHEERAIPVSIFHKQLTPLESVVRYLKEERKLKLCEIADVVKRDQRNVWGIYHRASKIGVKFSVQDCRHWIPVSVFNSKLSIFEAVVWHLKEVCGLQHREIAAMMQRDERTIWTVWNRARVKHAKR